MFLQASDLYEVARSAYIRSEQPRQDNSQRQHDALTAVAFAAFSVSAFLDELGALAVFRVETTTTPALIFDPTRPGQLPIERRTDPSRLEAWGTSLEKSLYQDTALLFRLRNKIGHLKPLDR
jgi:hypothetical protein